MREEGREGGVEKREWERRSGCEGGCMGEGRRERGEKRMEEEGLVGGWVAGGWQESLGEKREW